MQEQPNLAMTFLMHVPVRVAVPADAAELEGQLRCAWEIGRDPWPRVVLPADVFVRHLAQRLTWAKAGSPLSFVLDQLALSDLYLAGACVHDVPASIDMLESHYLAKLPAVLRHLKQPAMVIDEVCQSVRIHLLLGTTEAGAQLTEYTGRGALLSWIRVVAVRMALKLRAPPREAPDENILAAIEAMPASETDAELDLIKRRYRREFHQAMCESFAALPSEQRHQLRLHFIDQLPTTKIAALFRVNQSTVSRWIKSARKAVYEGTKLRIKERLELSSKDFSSLLTAIESQLDLNLHQVFEKEG